MADGRDGEEGKTDGGNREEKRKGKPFWKGRQLIVVIRAREDR